MLASTGSVNKLVSNIFEPAQVVCDQVVAVTLRTLYDNHALFVGETRECLGRSVITDGTRVYYGKFTLHRPQPLSRRVVSLIHAVVTIDSA